MSIEGERLNRSEDSKNNEGFSLAVEAESSEAYSTPRHSSDVEGSLTTCRVCHCVESDRRGDAALCFLDIDPPLQEVPSIKENQNLNNGEVAKGVEREINNGKDLGKESGVTEFVSPGGEIFICSTDLEAGFNQHHNKLICLGCSCKNDLSLVHYACALKWFVNHGSIVCEICGNVATNVRPSDFKKVVVSLKDYETLMEKTASGEPTSVLIESNSGVDPDAVAGIRRQRLCEIASWFNPNTTNNNNSNGVNINSSRILQGVADQSSNVPTEDAPPTESRLTKWAVEGTGILVATGLLTVTLAWLIAPRVGKKTAKNGLHFLLGGICALTVVVFLRFIVLSRIKYGPARYWAILFVFWFLVFGIWASRTHGSHSN